LSLTIHCHNDTIVFDSLAFRDQNSPPAILADNAGPQGSSSSMQGLVRRLLAALHAEGYGNNVKIADNNTVMEAFPERTFSIEYRQYASSTGVRAPNYARSCNHQ